MTNLESLKKQEKKNYKLNLENEKNSDNDYEKNIEGQLNIKVTKTKFASKMDEINSIDTGLNIEMLNSSQK